METRHLVPFFVITFAITWGVGAIVLLFGDALTDRFGDIAYDDPFWKTVFHLVTYAPALAAFALVAWVRGPAGVAAFARRLFRWRAGAVLALVIVLGYAALELTARAISSALTGAPEPVFDHTPAWTALPAFLLALIDDPGPVEEFGWRGFALPLLQRRFSALVASVILGVVWGVWHLPAFYIGGMNQASLSLPAFLFFTVVLSMLMTCAYNCTRGTVLLAFLLHGVANFEFAPTSGVTSTEFVVAGALGLVVVAVVARRFGSERLGPRRETAILADEAA